MKHITISILTLLLIIVGVSYTVGVSSASAANLDGHIQYTIVSYSFSGDDTDIPGNSGKDSLLITGTSLDILSDDGLDSDNHGLSGAKPVTDIIAVSADFAATPDISLHGAFGFSKNQEDYNLDLDYKQSWEANVGVIYKLFNNIRYEVHFGYMETGDLFKNTAAYTDEESIIMISNKLSMSF